MQSTRPLSQSNSSNVLSLLARLRQYIRYYVTIEGFSVCVTWLVASFWLLLAIDYLPILVGASEMPRTARRVALVTVTLGGFWILYRFIVRRWRADLPDASLALLIERQFPQFQESLVTCVQLADQRQALGNLGPDIHNDSLFVPYSSEMLAKTVADAEANLSHVKLRRVFRFAPLVCKLALATISIFSLVTFAYLERGMLSKAVSRLIWLSSEPWPRKTYLELVDFSDGFRKVAKGSDVSIRVRARISETNMVPEICSIVYSTTDRGRGRLNMSRDGDPRDDFQYFVYEGSPFSSILDDVQFDVIGHDYRLRNLRVQVVPSPVVASVTLECDLPTYTGLLPRRERWNPGLQLPMGTRIRATVLCNKPLKEARLRNLDTSTESVLSFADSTKEFSHTVDSLQGRMALSITLLDTDGILSEEPYLVTISAIEDKPPRVDVVLQGIGNAITPFARLPWKGTIQDDYQVERTWIEVRSGEQIREFAASTADDSAWQTAVDFRNDVPSTESTPMELQPDDQLVVTVRAQDRFNLDGSDPHIGSSDPRSLSVVRPDELLAILDGKELSLRRRFEQIIEELTSSRDSLLRLKNSWSNDLTDSEQHDSTTPSPGAADQSSTVPTNSNSSSGEVERGLAELRERWAQWALQKSDQSTGELAAITTSFEDIRDELLNNRVDTPERKSRLEDQIIAPLRKISEVGYPVYSRQLSQLQIALSDPKTDPQKNVTLSASALNEAENLLLAMEDVLQKMLELEDYTELVNIVRSLIEQQKSISERAREEQKQRALDLFK